MAMRSILYGFRETDLEATRLLLEQALGVALEPHESLYRGGDYYRHTRDDELDLILQRNYDALDDGPAEEEHTEMKVLLYVDGSEAAGRIEAQVATEVDAAQLLRRTGG